MQYFLIHGHEWYQGYHTVNGWNVCDAQKLVDKYCYSYDGKIRENPTFKYVQ